MDFFLRCTVNLIKININCLLTRSQSLLGRLPIHVRRLSMTDYEHLHYDKDRLCQAGSTVVLLRTIFCCISS